VLVPNNQAGRLSLLSPFLESFQGSDSLMTDMSHASLEFTPIKFSSGDSTDHRRTARSAKQLIRRTLIVCLLFSLALLCPVIGDQPPPSVSGDIASPVSI